MAPKVKQEAQNPLILRCHRLMEAFAKSNEERDFYLDRMEGFLVYVDLDKAQEDLGALEAELETNNDRYCQIPKLTFYETKKIMEGFVNEKVYDIDTKEKLIDIIQSKEARENFLEFIFDHHTEYDKWQQYYQERSRIRIIEWLRQNHYHFVFEEDLDLPKSMIEKLKRELFNPKVGKDILSARKNLFAKAKTYYSNEALNPRPKRGRPPKQAVKLEIEPQITTDIYTTVPTMVFPFLFTPDINSASAITFSSKFENEEDLSGSKRLGANDKDLSLTEINQKLASLRSISSRWAEVETEKKKNASSLRDDVDSDFEDDDWNDDEDEDEDDIGSSKRSSSKKSKQKTTPKSKAKAKSATSSAKASPAKKSPLKSTSAAKTAAKTPSAKAKSPAKSTKSVPASKAAPKKEVKKSSVSKKATPPSLTKAKVSKAGKNR
jgi:hypothetical protein